MKHLWKHLACLVLAAVLLTGCGKSEQQNGEVLLERVLNGAAFDTQLSEVGSNAVLYFPDLPEGTQIRLYTGSGYYADEAALLTVPRKKDLPQAEKVLENHLKELKDQFQNYVPGEVGKIERAVTVQSENQILLCISRDSGLVRALLDGSGSDAKPEQNLPEQTADPTLASAVPQSGSDPELLSRSGQYHDYENGVIRVDDAAFEQYTYTDGPAQAYADVVNAVAKALKGETKVYDLVIPTAVGIVLPDDIAKILPNYSDQGTATERILSKLSTDVIGVNPYENLRAHRTEYLYFHTDYHWNGRGAYYAYETFCQAKGIRPYSLEERREEQFPDFLGVLYWKHSGQDERLKQNPDTVEAFHPHSPRAYMRYTDSRGNTYDWNIISDVSDWSKDSKYSTFAAADNPIAVFQNPDVTDGSVAVVVKESYGNALLPYLVDHYSTVYELDYRYWSGSLTEFVREKGADDLIFANNLTMIGSNFLIGKLADIAK